MAIGNSFMDMINKGVKDTKKEGIMTAEQYKLGGDLNYVIEMMKNETDPDKLEELKSIIREMLGTSPYMSIRQSPDLKASNDEAVRQLEILFEMFKDQGMSDEEAEKAARERMESAAVRKAADGGIMYLAPGGSVRTPSTYESKAFEEYIAELGPEFQKRDPDTGKMRGSKGLWNKFVLTKGIKPSSTAATELLNDMRKAKGLSPYISTDMALKGYGKDAVEIATGTKTGQVGAADRDAFYKKSKSVFKEADNMEFKSKNDKYKFIEKQLVKAYPTLAGTTALATFISKRALGGIGAMMPSELEAATIYSPEDMEKILGEMKIREKFQ